MDTAVQAFKDKMAEKAAAKQKTLAAVGEAKLAEYKAFVAEHGREPAAKEGQNLPDELRAWADSHPVAAAAPFWDTVAEYGIKDGEEGKAFAEMQAMADAYVKAHPEQFVNVQEYVKTGGSDEIVKLISLMSKAGMEEEELKLTMFELANFERQQIGVVTQAQVRIVGKGK